MNIAKPNSDLGKIEATICTISKCKETITAYEGHLLEMSKSFVTEVETLEEKNRVLKASIIEVSADIKDALGRWKLSAERRHDDICAKLGENLTPDLSGDRPAPTVNHKTEMDNFDITYADMNCFSETAQTFSRSLGTVSGSLSVNSVDYKTLHLEKAKEVPMSDDAKLLFVAVYQNVIAVATSGSFLYIFSTENDIVKEIFLEDDNITTVEFIDTQTVIVGFSSGRVKLIDAPGATVSTQHKYLSGVVGLKVHPSKKYFFAATLSNWNVFSLEASRALRQTTVDGGITCINVHQSGKYVATGNGSLIQLWNVAEKECISTIAISTVTSLHFAMHGNWLCAGLENGVGLINTRMGHEKLEYIWTAPSEFSPLPNLTAVDTLGNLVSYFQGNNMWVLTTSHKLDNVRKHELTEVVKLDNVGSIIHAVVQIESSKPGIWVLKDRSLLLYNFL